MNTLLHRGRAAVLGLACAIAAALGGCASTAAPPPEMPPLVWPDEIDVPARIEFVSKFGRPEEYGIAKGFLQRVAEALFGADDARLIRPMSVVASGGVAYVADPGARGVHRFDTGAGEYALIGAADDAGLPSPVGLALGAHGEVFVTDSQQAQVLVIRPGAKVAQPLALPAMGQPTGIAFDAAAERLYVTDTAAHRVNVFNRDGTLHGSFGKRGTGSGEFNYPTMLWRDAAGQIYVTDSLNFRIQIFDAEGRFLRQFGQAGDGTGDNLRQKGVATDSYGHVYIVDALFNAVQIFDQDGRLLLSFGGMGREPGEFWLPAGIFIGGPDLIYVADSYNQRIQVFRYIGGPK